MYTDTDTLTHTRIYTYITVGHLPASSQQKRGQQCVSVLNQSRNFPKFNKVNKILIFNKNMDISLAKYEIFMKVQN